MFAWRSPAAKGLRDRRDTLSDEQLIDLMAGEPRLIRRPILVQGRKVIFGYRDGDYGASGPAR
jgi:arsenate reductase